MNSLVGADFSEHYVIKTKKTFTMRKIYIIGSGAVGLALAACLKAEGKEVCLLRGRSNQEARSLKKIQLVLADAEVEVEMELNRIEDFKSLDGIVVVTTKSYGNKTISDQLKNKTGSSPIVLLQNGLGIENAFVTNNFPEIYRCVLFVTSQIIAEDRVKFKPVSSSLIGTIKSNASKLDEIVGLLSSKIFPFTAEPNIQTAIWKKAIINSAFNSICPLLEVDNGIFHRDRRVLHIAERLIGECVIVANQSGISLTVEEVEEKLLQVSRSSDGQLISTLQDINNGRETEIETLNLEIARIAEGLGLAEKIMETRLLGEMILLKSQLVKLR